MLDIEEKNEMHKKFYFWQIYDHLSTFRSQYFRSLLLILDGNRSLNEYIRNKYPQKPYSCVYQNIWKIIAVFDNIIHPEKNIFNWIQFIESEVNLTYWSNIPRSFLHLVPDELVDISEASSLNWIHSEE